MRWQSIALGERKFANSSTASELAPAKVVRLRKRIGIASGATAPELVAASDGSRYVVKMCDNPLGPRVLANEFIMSVLSRMVGISAPAIAIVEEPIPGQSLPRLHFGSMLLDRRTAFTTIADLKLAPGAPIENLQEVVGALVLDVWVCNTDVREIAVVPVPRPSLKLTFIDNSHCFGSTRWAFGDYQLPQVHGVLSEIARWESVMLWVTRAQSISIDLLRTAALGMPCAWAGMDLASVEGLFERLGQRQRKLVNLVDAAIGPLLDQRHNRFSVGRNAGWLNLAAS